MKLHLKDNRAKTSESVPVTMLQSLKAFEGGARLLKTGQLSFVDSQYNISLFLNHFPNAEIIEEKPEIFDWSSAKLRPKFKEKRNGHFWQTEANQKIDKLIQNDKASNAFAFFYRPGGGKSKSLTDMAIKLYCEGRIDACIILSLNMLIAEQWISDHGALATDVQDDVKVSKWLWVKTKKAEKEYDQFKSTDACQFVSMNIDAAKTPRGEKLLLDFINHHKGRVLFAIDESHAIKTLKSGRHKAAFKLGNLCQWKAILTGTPIAKNVVDKYAQFKFLDQKILGYRFLTPFKAQYCIERFNGFANEVIGSKNLDHLYSKIEPHSTRVSESEMGLTKARDTFEFSLSNEQQKHYDELKKKWLTDLDSGEFASASIALTAALKMHQITSGYLTSDEGALHVFDDNSRLKALDALLETIDDEKIVIWCRFRQNAMDLMNHLGEQAIEISGNVDRKQRTPNKERFINDSNIRFLVATPDTAGTGMDGLQAVCNRAIFFNTSENYVQRTQAEDRVLRLGGETTSFYTDLICKKSGDRKILKNLFDKRETSRMSLDDVREIFT